MFLITRCGEYLRCCSTESFETLGHIIGVPQGECRVPRQRPGRNAEGVPEIEALCFAEAPRLILRLKKWPIGAAVNALPIGKKEISGILVNWLTLTQGRVQTALCKVAVASRYALLDIYRSNSELLLFSVLNHAFNFT